jgi:hypothetical protein
VAAKERNGDKKESEEQPFSGFSQLRVQKK